MNPATWSDLTAGQEILNPVQIVQPDSDGRAEGIKWDLQLDSKVIRKQRVSQFPTGGMVLSDHQAKEGITSVH